MCKTCPGVVDCAHDRETDEWPAPTWRNPRFQEAATSTLGGRAGTETPREPENVHAPALTPDGFTAALRALGRDGGESHV